MLPIPCLKGRRRLTMRRKLTQLVIALTVLFLAGIAPTIPAQRPADTPAPDPLRAIPNPADKPAPDPSRVPLPGPADKLPADLSKIPLANPADKPVSPDPPRVPPANP